MSSIMPLENKSSPPKIFIPDLLARWPYPPRNNPHYATVGKESADWVESFRAFSPKAQHAFNCCNLALLCSLAYPVADRERFRVMCDFTNITFVVDEYTDASSPSEVRQLKDVIMDALRKPREPRPRGECVLGDMVRQFWERATSNGMTELCRQRFIAAFDSYLEGVANQAIDRNGRRIRDVESYFSLRRETVGCKPVYALLEMALEIPDEVMSHLAMQEMVVASIDMIHITNDVTSYSIEQAYGNDGHNVITIVMNQYRTDINGAILWAQDRHTRAEQKFHAAMAALPPLEEPLKSQVKVYCDGLGNWVRANYVWSFETGRYFGNRGSEVMETRWVSLMPKHETGKLEVGPVLADDSLL